MYWPKLAGRMGWPKMDWPTLYGPKSATTAHGTLAAALAKLQAEELGLVDAKTRLAALMQESNGMDVHVVPATVPADFALKLAELRACVAATQASVPNCNPQQFKEAKNGRGNTPGVCQVRHSIWCL